MVELLKNVWVDQGCISAFWISERTEDGKTFFLRRKKEKVVGYIFTICLATCAVPLEYEVETKKERDEMMNKLKGVSHGK